MQLTRRQTWDPFREIEELSTRMNRLFGAFAPSTNGEGEQLALSNWAPSCDIKETEKEYRVSAELPGIKKDDVHVTLANGVLTIQGERKEEKEEKNEKVHRRELSYGSFLRRFAIPGDADESKIDASFKDGILNVAIAKSKTQSSNVKQIAVQ